MDQVDVDRCRSLLEEALTLAAAGKSLERVASGTIDGEQLAAALAPVAAAPATVRWLVTNNDRVDAAVQAEQMQWRVVFGSSDRQRIDWINLIARPDRFDGIDEGRVVVVNGPSGAGKSTIMKAIQAVAGVPWVVFDEPENVGAVDAGHLIWRDRAPRLHAGFLEAIAALARVGNYVALSAGHHSQEQLRQRFNDIDTLWVGLHCDRAKLLEREQRPGRWGGIADESLEVHQGWRYDLEFDTTNEPDPAAIAAEIIRVVDSSLRTVSPMETKAMPAGIALRPMEPADVELWVEASMRFRGRSCSDRAMQEFLMDPAVVGFLAVDGSMGVVGWSWGHVHRHVEGFMQGQLYGIAVSESHRRMGIGACLVKSMRSSFVEMGAARMWLFTDEDNTPAKALYEVTGGVASPHDDATYWWQLETQPENRL